jgi:hypothetical protein
MKQNVMVNTTLPSDIVFYFHEQHLPVEQLHSVSEEEKIALLETYGSKSTKREFITTVMNAVENVLKHIHSTPTLALT